MRFEISRLAPAILWPVITIACLTRPASGQEQEIALDTLPQAGQAAGGLSSFDISGFGVASFDYRSTTDENSIAAGKLAVSVFKRAGPNFSFFGQLTTLFEEEPPGAPEEEPAEEGGHGPAAETEIDNLIISFTPPGAPEVNLWLGRFDAEVGFERDDEPLNLQPTTSFNFVFARPVKFTGLLARYTPMPTLSLAGFVVNGWDVAQDNNQGKTFGARVSLLPSEYSHLAITGLIGPEKEDNTDDNRYLVSGDFTIQAARPLILAGEFNYGSEENAAPDGGSADWIGGLITGFVRLTRNFGVTARAEVFDDRDGSRTGEPRTLQSYTIAPMLFFRTAVAGIFNTVPHTSFTLPQFALRAGIRRNISNNPFFAGEGDLQERETRLVVEGIFIY